MANPFGLTDQQKRFADGVLKGMIQREAYESAGYKARGASADSNAARLLRNAKIEQYLDDRREKLAKKAEVTQERIVQEYARIAFADIRKLFTWDEQRAAYVPSRDLTDDEAAAISEIQSETVTVKPRGRDPETTVKLKIKTYDKKGALDSLAKIMGMMTERTINVDISNLTTEELERIANGEDPLSVLADTRAGGARAEEAA